MKNDRKLKFFSLWTKEGRWQKNVKLGDEKFTKLNIGSIARCGRILSPQLSTPLDLSLEMKSSPPRRLVLRLR